MTSRFKSRAFRVHFNRNAMQRGSDLVWTIHVAGQCVPAKQVKILTAVDTVYRPKAAQPRAYFVGAGVVLGGPREYMIVDPPTAKRLVNLNPHTPVIVPPGTSGS